LFVMAMAFPNWLKAINKRREDRVRRILAAMRADQPEARRPPRGSA
jgi:type II secretory pathway pseudopilin PulG